MKSYSNPPTPEPVTSEASRRASNAYSIGLWSGILFLVISIISTISTILTGLYAFYGIILTFALSAISFLGAFLARREKAAVGSAILVTSVIFAALFLPFVAKGQGIPLAALVIVTVSSIASYTLDNRWAARATTLSVVIGFIIILSDQLLPDFGIPTDPRVTLVISVVAGAIYLLGILRRFGTFPLRAKIVIAFFGITLIPIIILGALNNAFSRNILVTQAEAGLSKLAEETAHRIDTYFTLQLETIQSEAQTPALVDFLQLPENARADSVEASSALRTLQAFTLRNPGAILSYNVLDTRGKILLETAQNPGAQTYLPDPAKLSQPVISNLVFESESPVIFLSAPIRSESGALLGALRARYNASILQNLLRAALVDTKSGQALTLVDRESYLRLATTVVNGRLYVALKDFSAGEFSDRQARKMLPPGSTADVLAPDPDFARGIDESENQPIFRTLSEAGDEKIVAAGASVVIEPWVVTAIQPEKTIFTRADEQARLNIFTALALTMLTVLAALIVSATLSRPVTALASVASQVTKGDLNARAQVRTDDEVGALAQAFNAMTTQLSQTLAGLEERVAERTLELQTATEKSDQRSRQLQSIAEISRIIAREQSIDRLLPLAAEIVSEQFGYYHIGIFLLDDARRTAILQAANSPGGQKMLANGHRLPLGTDSIVGFCALTGKPRIALDVDQDVVFFNNPNLPATHSEMALPLFVRGLTIGVLDLQSIKSAAFTEEDVKTLSILADQLAIAIDNARLFRQTQTALKESQSVVESFLRQEWTAIARKQSSAGYMHSPLGGKLLNSPLQSADIDEALKTGGIVQRESKSSLTSGPSLAVPIKLGQQTIGAIRIQSIARTRGWTPEELNLIRAIAERVGLALENARLISTSQKRASKERTISEMTTRISAATDMETILKTAVQELGRVLSGSDVVIQLEESQDE